MFVTGFIEMHRSRVQYELNPQKTPVQVRKALFGTSPTSTEAPGGEGQ